MKPLLFASFALAALPLAAGETPQTAPPAPTPTATTTAAAPATTTDSPLVAAAKKSSAKKRKATIVITNDNLIKSGGHITTTASQPPLPSLPPALSAAELKAEQDRRDAQAKLKRDAEEKAKSEREAAQRTLAATDGGAQTMFDDPAVAEHVAEEQAKKAKEKEAKKPPM
jgi:hypothetical protein